MKKKKKKNATQKAPLWQIRITAYSNGTMNVTGFSKTYANAMNQLNAARDVVTRAFIGAAKDNRLSDGLVIDETNLIIPKKGLFVPNVR